ncbi:ribonuclease H2 subunit C [Ixodes scapularis]|uniref:Uncharacterized protein n=1 Tax=Ixodes scapularis TaxID=6945 RepID=B7PGQ9_IXOSC|nr:ribonuclease H2 subunit C [Ixodes scapularis]EEC05781.1 conserved hypothetical protein [Ixodes scapularis]|eukprot:XP_002401244.1 conserved hypothetical protein [Ixodes scapularis]
MAAAADLKLESSRLEEKVRGHLLPCEIKHRGAAKVSSFFEPFVEPVQDSKDVLKASFRGRPLIGRQVPVPPDFAGVVFKTAATDSDSKSLYASGRFDEFVCWNWSTAPSNNDKVAQLDDWVAVANALHANSDG